MNTHHVIRGIITDNAGVLDLFCGVTHPRDSADGVLFTVARKMGIVKFQYRSSSFVKTHRLVCMIQMGERRSGFKPFNIHDRTFRASPKRVNIT